MKKDSFGDRMKHYEKMNEPIHFPYLPTFARVDGRAFHTFVKGLEKPFDLVFTRCMQTTALKLAKETNALLTYTQSDEITLMWYSEDIRSELFFNNKHSKMVSHIASLATLYFYRECEKFLGKEYAEKLPMFDARVWQVPNKSEAANVFLWREKDAVRNSIQSLAQSNLPPTQVWGSSCNELLTKLSEKDIVWEDLPYFYRHGTYIQKQKTLRVFTCDEIDRLPEKHHARLNPELLVERKDFVLLDMRIEKIQNKTGFIFDGDKAITE